MKKMQVLPKFLFSIILFLILVLFLLTSSKGKSHDFSPEIQALVDSVSTENIFNHIEALCWADGYQSRVTFTPGNYKAVEYLENYFRSLTGITEVFLDTFYISSAIAPYDHHPLINIIATLKGKSAESEMILLGGHYDSSGSRENNYSANWQTLRAQGADDNASGVAAMMEIARILSDPNNDLQNINSIKFIAFAAEEYHPKIPNIHHAGSLYDAYYVSDKQEKLSAAIILDMIAYNTITDYIEVISNTQSSWLASFIFDTEELYSLELKTNTYPVNVPYSDHESYQFYNYPAVLLMENDSPWYDDPPDYTANPYYHTQSDTASTLRESLLEKVAKLALASVASLSMGDETTLISDNNVSESFQIFSVYPNPFNENTKFKFYLNIGAIIKFTIYNFLGEQVIILADKYFLPGDHEIIWHGKNTSSGVYFCRVQSQNINYIKKVTLIK